jgi:mycothiol synthase
MSEESSHQVQMVWPRDRLALLPAAKPPPGYLLRTYRQGDEARFYELMALAGWPGWDAETLQPWLERMLPEGWFLAIHQGSNQIVATAMALRDCSEFGDPGGELGWVASDPVHRGQGLGLLVSAAVTRRLLAERYQSVHLYTEPWRLAALKTYLKLGYVPLLATLEAPEPWPAICAQLQWPFTPQVWG